MSVFTWPLHNVINAVLKGDEWNNWVETTEGYTISKDTDEVWYYVEMFDDAKPVLSSIPAHEEPLDIHQMNLRPEKEYLESSLSDVEGDYVSKAPSGSFSGNILFILVEFTDRAGTYPESAWGTFLSNNIADFFDPDGHFKIPHLWPPNFPPP